MKPGVMKRRLLVFSLLMVPTMASAQPADWQTVVGSDLRFRLALEVVPLVAVASEIKHAKRFHG